MIILTRVLKFILDIMSSILIIINIIYYISSDFTLYLYAIFFKLRCLMFSYCLFFII